MEDINEQALQLQKHTEQIRLYRNKLLSDCDWTQLPDSTADKPSWAIYRNLLRDVPSQVGFPLVIDWPEPPVT